MTSYQSWGQYPPSTPRAVLPMNWPSDSIPFSAFKGSFLPYACGRSYGDSCLNNEGTLVDMRPLRRFISFNERTGILKCEAGITISEILHLVVEKGWFIPVTPGTQFVSIGGAIANDVHGKNHHRAGTFGNHVRSFELMKSSGDRILCSRDQNSQLFAATIGGLGLTGIITSAEIQLRRVTGPWITTQRVRFTKLKDFFDLSSEGDKSYEYTVAWIDCFAKGPALGRGIFIRGNHQTEKGGPASWPKLRTNFTIPANSPIALFNSATLKVFNYCYYHYSPKKAARSFEPYDRFFYPLDSIHNANRLYGSRGFLQYQCVVPQKDQEEGIRALLTKIQQSKQGSSLAVLKQFGQIPSPGILSFPRPGTTLALDFPNQGNTTLNLLDQLDELVNNLGGAVYPAKDARMAANHFQRYFPRWKEFSQFIDPKFSSNFWRRVTQSPEFSKEKDLPHFLNPDSIHQGNQRIKLPLIGAQ